MKLLNGLFNGFSMVAGFKIKVVLWSVLGIALVTILLWYRSHLIESGKQQQRLESLQDDMEIIQKARMLTNAHNGFDDDKLRP